MLNYVNSIFCAFNPIENSFVIKMSQEEPVDQNSPDQKPVSTEITSIVMSKDLALRMAENISNICKQE